MQYIAQINNLQETLFDAIFHKK